MTVYPKNGFSPYAHGHAYCSRCGRFYPVDEAPRARNGAPLCPRHLIVLRTKSRTRRTGKPRFKGERK